MRVPQHVFPEQIAVDGVCYASGLRIDAARRDAELVVCDRILALLGVLPAPGDPDRIAALYFEAASACVPDAGWLQAALQVLPPDADVERRFLAAALARAAEMSLAPAPAVVAAPAPPPAAAFQPDQPPHACLEACFDALESQPGFEARAGQRDMAHAVLDAFLERRPVIVEAGTGIGKTLAYALPAVVLAAAGRRVLLSTHTRNLQHQLYHRDLPAMWGLLGLASLDLQFAKLLGRDNYICDQALARWVGRCRDQGGSIAAARLVLSRLRNPDGIVADAFDDGVPVDVLARREVCVGRVCRTCPVHRAREVARRADVVVVNHALLFADARTESTVLGDWDALVLDESHHVQRVATQAFGMRFGRAQVEALGRPAQRLHAETTALRKLPGFSSWSDRLDHWCERQRDLQQRLAAWLADLDAALPQRGRERPRQRYRDGDEAFGPVRSEAAHLVAHMQQITTESQSWLGDLQDLAAEQPILDDAITLFELALELHFETQNMLGFLVRGCHDDWAFYLDFAAAGRALREIVALPLDVAPQLRDLLHASPRGIAFTSATLYVDDDTAWFRSRIGLDPCPALRIESPFDYATQCRALSTSGLGAAADPDFVPRLADLVAELCDRTGRRTLVLLTSHRALQGLAAELEKRGAAVLAQGLHGTRADLAQRFTATPGAILLGVDSFWEGVDFPGDALELLVIAKLPFAVPDEPLVAARAERLRAAGEDPFEEFVLPEAVLRFRQGFGRLIRSPHDRGAVVLLDPRLETREYGERFLAALPARVEAFETAGALADAVADWFALVESAPRREVQ